MTERHQELACLHALGLLEGPERAAFEAEAAADRDLRRLVDELGESTARLALAAPDVPPPARLKDRILASAAAVAPAAPPPPASAAAVPFPVARAAPWALAASLAVFAGWLVLQNLGLRRESESLRTEAELADAAYRMSQGQLRERSLLAEGMINDLGRRLRRQEDLSRLKITALAALAGDTREAEAIAVWDPDLETGLLTVDRLPALAATQDYQIWIVDPSYPAPVDGGVFRPGDDGRAVLTFKGDKPIRAVDAFAISVERKGGVPQAEGPIVLLGK